jgi:hypothetical protein
MTTHEVILMAPRGQEQPAPRAATGSWSQDAAGAQTNVDRAQKLVGGAEAAVQARQQAVSAEKAHAAIDPLE